ncbi:MAG: mandelate racemase/muconate lactonizing enzyme family protein [Pseudomonadota bacterium]
MDQPVAPLSNAAADRAPIAIERIEAFALACHVEGGPVSSLALMPLRTGLLIKLTASDGATGWGEAWCNYPPRGNLNKLALLEDPIAPAVFATSVADWRDLRPALEAKLHRMAIHTGEPGPFAHTLAGLDMAAADLCARRADMGLAAFLGAPDARSAAVYASSPDVSEAETLAARLSEAGHTGVKIKIGFDGRRDLDVLSRFRAGDAAALALFVDANQNWDVAAARSAINALAAFGVGFVEEPILATAPLGDWRALAAASPIKLAAGENIAGADLFAAHVRAGALGIVQPDVAKWGGVSGALEVGAFAHANGAGCTLHYMGTAVGLATSLHTLAAIGGDGRVELDHNPNPLRTALGALDLTVRNGRVDLPLGPGIGFEPDPSAIARLAVASADITRQKTTT